jgi:flavin reductase (DIM6/NTAB) family NADH-FMN oxidoreductase RutF
VPANTDVATVDLVIGKVVRVHIDDRVITSSGKLDVLKIKPIARLGYFDFTVVDNSFEMVPPEASDEELAGLEGKTL